MYSQHNNILEKIIQGNESRFKGAFIKGVNKGAFIKYVRKISRKINI